MPSGTRHNSVGESAAGYASGDTISRSRIGIADIPPPEASGVIPQPYFIYRRLYDADGIHVGDEVRGFIQYRIPYAGRVHDDGSVSPLGDHPAPETGRQKKQAA